ncbi:MAG: MGMT family protein [Deltaproteobacteria bacterium]|nr:MGMT family protein [Deltaproteobacteria bacterium]
MAHLHFDTAAGRGLLEYGGEGILSVQLPSKNAFVPGNGSSAKCGGWKNAEKALQLLLSYYDGKAADFSPLILDLGGRSNFFLKVCNLVRNIPYGEVLTYGEVAKLAESPHASRAVGRVMAANPIPVIIPCHRVVASNGLLTGYSAEGGLETKADLLRMEGVPFRKKGMVDVEKKGL